ncbi:hypothetical protein OEZ85_010614 [Tetradesmus obliquus]|uniref:Uncharacterized protein n=1 Tax=Tetradesmus obliquus TaxID=3088 RepID=A0ABY8TN49_TETOB|nr:hypothetical protein OEZ85_010614 [Tetradesmus obliquus]
MMEYNIGMTASPVSSTTFDATTTTPTGPSLSLDNFNYTAGNTADLPGPQQYPDGLDKGQVAGVVIGCLLGGLFLGSLLTLCYLKRRRLFPERFGPPKHPDEAAPIHPIDVLRSGTKLDKLTKEELLTPKSFIGSDANRPADIRADIHAADRV